MQPSTTMQPSVELDPTNPLPASVCRSIMRELSYALPDPVDDTPDRRIERDHAAIAEIALLAPANAAEMRIAIRCITTDAWTSTYMRHMNAHGGDIVLLLRIGVQAANMGRAPNANHAALLRVQAERRSRQPDTTPDADAAGAARACRADAGLAGAAGGTRPAAAEGAAGRRRRRHAGRAAPGRTPRAATAARHPGTTPLEQAIAARRQEAAAAAAAGAPEPDWMTPAWRHTLGLPEPPPPTEDDRQRQRAHASRQICRPPSDARAADPPAGRPAARLRRGISPARPAACDPHRRWASNLLWADRLTPAQARQNAGRDRDLLCRYEAEGAAPGVRALLRRAEGITQRAEDNKGLPRPLGEGVGGRGAVQPQAGGTRTPPPSPLPQGAGETFVAYRRAHRLGRSFPTTFTHWRIGNFYPLPGGRARPTTASHPALALPARSARDPRANQD